MLVLGGGGCTLTILLINRAWMGKKKKNVPQFKVLASLQGQLALGLALDALQSQDNLLGGLGLLVEDGLGLTTVTALLSVVTALTLREQRGLAGLVLRHLVLGVLAALLALAVGVSGLGNVDLVVHPVSATFHMTCLAGDGA